VRVANVLALGLVVFNPSIEARLEEDRLRTLLDLVHQKIACQSAAAVRPTAWWRAKRKEGWWWRQKRYLFDGGPGWTSHGAGIGVGAHVLGQVRADLLRQR
jgi:hypothetical protein